MKKVQAKRTERCEVLPLRNPSGNPSLQGVHSLLVNDRGNAVKAMKSMNEMHDLYFLLPVLPMVD
jgi:hypothetical protein